MDTKIVLFESSSINSEDMRFILNTDPIPGGTYSSTSSSSDAQSAPTDDELLLDKLCDEYTRCVHEAGKVLPGEWTMPELLRMLVGDDSINHAFLNSAYYDLMICGTRSWVCEEVLDFISLFNYQL